MDQNKDHYIMIIKYKCVDIQLEVMYGRYNFLSLLFYLHLTAVSMNKYLF